MSEKWRQKLQALLYDYRHSASDRALEHQVKISFCLSRKIVRKKLDDVGQCREGKWEQSTVTILSMWTNNAWLNRTSISQTWSSASILGWQEIIKSRRWQSYCVSHVPSLNCRHYGSLTSRLGSLTILALNNLMMMMMILTIWWWGCIDLFQFQTLN